MGASWLDRRAFLRAGATSAAGVALAAGLSDCSSPSGPAHLPTDGTHAPPSAAQWRALAASLRGRLVRPGERAYATVRLGYNPKFDGQRPAAIALCATPTDVARTIAFAREHDIELAPRCGGHSYGGYSGGTGRLVVDVSAMSGVHPAPAPGGTATVGAGARLIDVYNVLGNAGQLVPGGSCPTVGVTGLVLGGGVGVLARRYGLACDHLRAVQLVTADGVVHRATRSSNEDLLWASQGGGGGNFGVVTSLEFATHALPELTLFTYDFPFDGAVDLLGAWQRWTDGLDPVVWSNCQLLSGGGTAARVAGVACAPVGTTAALLAPLLRAAPSATYSFLGGESYLRTMMVEAGCSQLSVAACHLDTVPGGTLSRQAFTASSNYVATPMSDAKLTAAVDAVTRLADDLPELGGGLVFDALGGAVNVPSAADTAFVHRRYLASIQSSFNWTGATPAVAIRQGASWLEEVRHTVYDAANGAYQNYIDPTLPDWATAYYGENLARLRRIKRSVDPDDVFHFAQSIPR